MPGLNLNFGTSVLKREAKSIDRVSERLKNAGWEKEGELGGGKIQYFSKASINITAVEGPLGTVIMPSGPVRGAMFGGGVGINRTSVIGAGADKKTNKKGKSRKNTRDEMI